MTAEFNPALSVRQGGVFSGSMLDFPLLRSIID